MSGLIQQLEGNLTLNNNGGLEVSLSPEYQGTLNTLKALSSDLQKKGVRSALHAAAGPLVAAMKANAPDDPRTSGSRLSSSINKTQAKAGRKVITGAGTRIVSKAEGEIALLVGPNKKVQATVAAGDAGPSKGKLESPGYIGWFLEKGAKAHMVGVIRNRRLAAKLKAAGVVHPRKRFGMVPILAFGGRFAMGPIPHPGAPSTAWLQKAYASTESTMETHFYQGLEKWMAKHGR